MPRTDECDAKANRVPAFALIKDHAERVGGLVAGNAAPNIDAVGSGAKHLDAPENAIFAAFDLEEMPAAGVGIITRCQSGQARISVAVADQVGDGRIRAILHQHDGVLFASRRIVAHRQPRLSGDGHAVLAHRLNTLVDNAIHAGPIAVHTVAEFIDPSLQKLPVRGRIGAERAEIFRSQGKVAEARVYVANDSGCNRRLVSDLRRAICQRERRRSGGGIDRDRTACCALIGLVGSRIVAVRHEEHHSLIGSVFAFSQRFVALPCVRFGERGIYLRLLDWRTPDKSVRLDKTLAASPEEFERVKSFLLDIGGPIAVFTRCHRVLNAGAIGIRKRREMAVEIVDIDQRARNCAVHLVENVAVKELVHRLNLHNFPPKLRHQL